MAVCPPAGFAVDVIYSTWEAWGAVQQYGAGVAEPLISLSEFTPLSAYNYGQLRDPVVTKSVEQGLATYDDEKRAELATKAEKAQSEYQQLAVKIGFKECGG